MLQPICLQQQGISDKPMLYETCCMIYLRSLIYYALHVCIPMNVYIPNHLVYHVPTINTNIYWHVVCLLHNVYFFCIVFHHVELRSTTASLLVSQPCKYICMYVIYQVPRAYIVYLLPKYHMLGLTYYRITS